MVEMPLVIIMVIYFYTYKMNDMCSVYRYATGIFEIWKLVPLFAGIFNLTLSLLLVRVIGLYGFVLSSIAAFLFVYSLFYCYPIIINCFKSKKRFWIYIKTQAVYMMCAIIIASIVYWLTSLCAIEGIIGFVFKCFLTVVLSGLFISLMAAFSPYRERILILLRKITLKRWPYGS